MEEDFIIIKDGEYFYIRGIRSIVISEFGKDELCTVKYLFTVRNGSPYQCIAVIDNR